MAAPPATTVVGTGATGAPAERLIVFGRWPRPGTTKTRLIPALGDVRAAELQRRMTLRTVDVARRWADQASGQVQVCYEGGSWRQVRRWLGSGLAFARQHPGDLGRRMAAALEAAFRNGCRRAVLIGTDIPDASPAHLAEAFARLADHDLVLGPTRDGGYWLIGMKRPVPVFGGIAWSTGSVLAQTLDCARNLGLRVHLLAPLPDVDRPEDLPQARGFFDPSRPIISVVIPARNEAGNIEAAIESATAPGVEVILVDGGSTDGMPARAAAMGVRVIHSPPGRAGQQNAAAALARADILLFLHADTALPPGYAADVFEAMLDRSAVGGGFLWRTDDNRLAMRLAGVGVRIRTVYRQQPWGDQAIFVRKTDFDALGGFPDVPVAEDLDFVVALGRRGRIVTIPRPVLTSARRWRRVGVVRGFLTNFLIVLGCRLGVSRDRLAKLYQ